MKVQITAQSLAAACDRARVLTVADRDARAGEWANANSFTMAGWWPWRHKVYKTAAEIAEIETRYKTYVFRSEPLRRIDNLQSIARHKRPETIFELTHEELEGISPYLSVYEDHGGRV